MTEPDEALLQLMQDVTEARHGVQATLQQEPGDTTLHRIHGMYIGHLLDIRKAALQETAADKDQLLIDALKGVVTFLIHRKHEEAAQLIGDHLEDIGNQVKLTWQDTKLSPNWPAATQTSVACSKKKSRPSAKRTPAKKKSAKPAPKATSASSRKPTSRTT